MSQNNYSFSLPKRNIWRSLQDAWKIARPFWQSDKRWPAIGLAVTVVTFNLLTVWISVLINSWNNAFYNSLQQFDRAAFFQLLGKFSYLAFFFIACRVIAYYANKTLEIRWRSWLTDFYLGSWLGNHAYYKTRFVESGADNPDQRISQDIGSFISITLSLTLGFISNLVSLFSFVFILWSLSGPLALTIWQTKIVIPGYMVWVALIYAFIGTWIVFQVGRPLVQLNYQQERVEADFRYGLMRVREHDENIAFYQGEQQEQATLGQRFTQVVTNFVAIIHRQMKLSIFNSGYGQIAIIFPILVAAPRYFSKAINLGTLMQISSAFGQVQGSLSYFIDSYGALASWRAIMDRLAGFQHSIDASHQLVPLAKQSVAEQDTVYLKVSDLAIYLPKSEQALVSGINLQLAAGDRLLVKGRSGSGKTCLLRVLAGIWPYASGSLQLAPQRRELFIAQQPYMPLIALRAAICYPLTDNLPSDAELQQIMTNCGLAHLIKYLEHEARWDKILSLGEMQRIGFARILINRPDIVYLDEATSALDEELEAQLYDLICSSLANSVIISIGHRSTLGRWHTQELNFNQLKSA